MRSHPVANHIAVVYCLAVFASTAVAEERLRTWTNRAGNRRVEAKLIAVRGSELRLQNAAGRPAKTTLESLSDADRRYVAAFLKSQRAGSLQNAGEHVEARQVEELPAMPIVRGIFDKIAGLAGSPTQQNTPANTDSSEGSLGLLVPLLSGSFRNDAPQQQPANLVHVRVSHAYLAGFVSKNVDRQSAVRDQILGTQISGTARTRGVTELVLHPSDSSALAEVIFRGTIQSSTVGYNGPVRLHSTAQTPFESRKSIVIDQQGIRSGTSNTWAQTRSTTNYIEALLPGLRGRIAHRVAWRRAGEMRGQADAIASAKARRQLSTEFDRTVDHAVADARGALRLKFAEIALGPVKLPEHLRYRSTPSYVEMVLRNPDAPPQTAATKPDAGPSFDGKAEVAIRVHRIALRNALTGPDISQALKPLMSGILVADGNGPTSIQPASIQAAPDFDWSWSSDGQWIQVDFSRGKSRQSAPPPSIMARGTLN